MKDGFVTTKTFGRIHYMEAGAGKPVILLQSNGASAYEYADVYPVLKGNRRVIGWDQPGQGDSDRITRHHSVEDYGDAVVEFMDALGLERASVLGCSIGGAIAIDLGVRHAARIDRLFIAEAPFRSAEQWAIDWPQTEANWSFPVQARELVEPKLRHLTDAHFARWNIDRQKAGPWTMLDVMWALRLYDTKAALPKVRAENTMVLFGSRSRLKAAAAVFQELLRGARHAILEDCGHFPMIDDPEQLARVVDEFMGD